ncbi:GGDEF domain-containing protein [Halopseudomonas pelagia]|uniref:diguanylate cyclase n=2 Tax=Halopseudomonas pelagia TaxID=553151 RepID=A0AA91Z6W7_9GAMM|nr:GGDEF domain-containing protein [Halopseudomonas pelagia]QFY55102.1 GGDEF domain-containing protein [Halopseudomonas pelagia]
MLMSDSRTPLTATNISNVSPPFDQSIQEELLKRGLVRLSIAADGMDPLLDKRLKELRLALRNDAAPQLLAELMPDLERAVLAADAARQERLEKVTSGLHALIRQLQKQPAPEDISKALQQMAKRLDQPIEYASSVPELLSEVVSLQASTLGSELTGTRPAGLWSRLFGNAAVTPISTSSALSAADQTAPSPDDELAPAFSDPAGVLAGEEQNYSQVAAHIETILLNLLGELQVLDSQQTRCEQLRERVTKGLNWYELAAAMDELAALVMGAQQSRQADFERYLQQLNSRLAQFQGNIEQAHESYNESREAGRALEGSIREQVEELHVDVRQATELESLKANVEAQLNALLSNVERSRQLRDDQETLVAGQLDTMVQRIQVMEVEAQTFRNHLEEQRQRAMIDSLTGMANRAGLQKRMEEEFERWQRYGGELLMAVLDVDHFKSINDRFGHLAGDKVLRLIAQQLSRRLRKTDFIGRFGGEEFVLLMPGTTVEQAASALEALRQGIEESPFHFKTERVTITISVGYTAFKRDDTLDEVFGRADRAMYQAKEQGRNRIVSAD